MKHLSPKQLVEDRSPTESSISARTLLVLTAWLSTLLLSKLPLVIARDILGTDLPWMIPLWIGIATLLFTATFLWQSLSPLRRYFVVLGVIYLWTALDALIRGTVLWQNLMAGHPEMVAIFADRVLLVLNSGAVIAVLFMMGAKRRDIFLTVGDLNAPAGGEAPTGKKRILSWAVLGPGMAVLLGGSFFAFLVSQTQGDLPSLSVTLPWIPLILLCAAMNAFGEEVTFRAATLGTLLPAIGPKHALWMTSLWFGLGHYYGGFPSGPAGLVQSGLLALLMGKAMLDTRGLGWPWIIHVAIDTAIYTFITISVFVSL